MTAESVAQDLGLDPSNVIANVLPSEKATHCKQMQKQGKVVAMIGDGINDSPALGIVNSILYVLWYMLIKKYSHSRCRNSIRLWCRNSL